MTKARRSLDASVVIAMNLYLERVIVNTDRDEFLNYLLAGQKNPLSRGYYVHTYVHTHTTMHVPTIKLIT